MDRVLRVVMMAALLLNCGPSGDRVLQGERISIVEESGWGVENVSLAPDGRWAAVAATRGEPSAFRLFLLDLSRDAAIEAKPSWSARGQLLAENRPGTMALEWAADSGSLRFPAANVSLGHLTRNFKTMTVQEQSGVATGSRAWFTVSLEEGTVGMLELDESPEALRRPSPRPHAIDERVTARLHSRGAFDLVDSEGGRRTIAEFRSSISIDLVSATISPDGQWIGVTLAREAFGSLGDRGFVVRREDGSLFRLGDQIYRPLRFHPSRREVFGVSQESSGRAQLMRWRF